MVIIPAIDIKNGKCVGLIQGKFESEKIYDENPVTTAKQWVQQGAQMLHVVDLDGAKEGSLVNLDVIKRMIQEVNIPIQVGGGIRNKETIETLLSLGVSQIILGTIALENEREFKSILKKFGKYITVALNSRNGKLMTKGWFEKSEKNTLQTAQLLEALGVKRFIFTDVIKDGTLTEPNYQEITALTQAITTPVIASGGISNIESIKKLKAIEIEGIIVGKALYEGKIDLKEALYVS